jgi:LytTr DNA-binding domain
MAFLRRLAEKPRQLQNGMRDMPENFANGGPIQLALRETLVIISNPRTLMVFAIIVLVFAVTGPFGTLEEQGFIERLGFWLVAQAASWLIAIFSITLADIAFGQRLEPAPFRIVATGIVAGIPVSLASLVFDGMPWRSGEPLDAETILRTFSTSIPLTIAFSALCWLALRNDAVEPDSARHPDVTASLSNIPPILARLPVEKRGALIRLSAADHYVEIVTVNGTGLVLMRLADAIAEAAPTEGMQVHRSHWLALAAVKSVKADGGRMLVEMPHGETIPVSRAQAPELRRRLESNPK